MSAKLHLLAATLTALFFGGGARGQGLPDMPFPAANPFSESKALLGKFLFHEEQLSSDATMACATCHAAERALTDPRATTPSHPGDDGVFGTDDDLGGSRGVISHTSTGEFVADAAGFFPEPQVTRRRSPTLLNVGFTAIQDAPVFWDGRASNTFTGPQSGRVEIAFGGALESQAIAPLLDPIEMGFEGRTWDDVTARLASVRPLRLARDLPAAMSAFRDEHTSYPAMFTAAFGDAALTAEHVAMALATYERTLVADQTPFDAFLAGDVEAFTPSMIAGLSLFTMETKGDCSGCHLPPFLTDHSFHNTGTRPDTEDIGLFAVTGSPADIGRFKTPTLRNIGERVRFFHAGNAARPDDMLATYEAGGNFNSATLDEDIQPFDLTRQERDDLTTFLLDALRDPRVGARLAPFDRPTLRTEVAPTSNVVYGQGTGTQPTMLNHVPAFPGHATFTIGLADVALRTPVILALSNAAARPPVVITGSRARVHVDTAALLLVIPTEANSDGIVSTTIPIPANESLTGRHVFAQWFLAAPEGLIATPGLRIEIL